MARKKSNPHNILLVKEGSHFELSDAVYRWLMENKNWSASRYSMEYSAAYNELEDPSCDLVEDHTRTHGQVYTLNPLKHDVNSVQFRCNKDVMMAIKAVRSEQRTRISGYNVTIKMRPLPTDMKNFNIVREDNAEMVMEDLGQRKLA